MAEDYVEAAHSKIGIARRYLVNLDKLRAGQESEREDIQLNFEGVITSGSSAADQVAEALTQKLGLRVRNASPDRVLAAVSDQDPEMDGLAPCLEFLRKWTREPVVIDAHRRRNKAVHHHYTKRPYRAELTWMLDQVRIDGEVSPYQGALDVHSYCSIYVAALATLEEAARCIEASD